MKEEFCIRVVSLIQISTVELSWRDPPFSIPPPGARNAFIFEELSTQRRQRVNPGVVNFGKLNSHLLTAQDACDSHKLLCC